MQDYFVGYGYAAIFLLAGFGFVLVTLAVSNLLGPKKVTRIKLQPYESGVEPVGQAWVQIPVHFFIFGLLFVIFDVEALFVLAWAVLFKSLGILGFVEMLIFILVLLAGLVYAWKKGVLQWT
ncbi:MAG: NADH-quinone oxidoreductase subunit A [Chloroflexi bacterium]|nr:NADH-quinone oxidoreductase subunit A [Chloroflexota bacterium]